MRGDMKHMNSKMSNKKLLGKKILIAGGTGFIGKNVIQKLVSEGAQVFAITRRKMQDDDNVIYLHCDLLNPITLSECYKIVDECDAAIYMAASIPLQGQKKESYLDAKCATLDPFVNFCEVLLCKVKKLIYISSVDVLGRCNINGFLETEKPNIVTPYGLAKYCGELYAKHYSELYSIDCLIYRFSQVYGPNEPIVRIIPIIKEALLYDKEFNLYTDGNEKRRFLNVEDAAQAILCGLLTNETGLFNIAGREVISILELIRMMESIWEKKLQLNLLCKSIGYDNIPNIDKSIKKLGYIPCISMYEGLKKVKEADDNAGIK